MFTTFVFTPYGIRMRFIREKHITGKRKYDIWIFDNFTDGFLWFAAGVAEVWAAKKV